MIKIINDYAYYQISSMINVTKVIKIEGDNMQKKLLPGILIIALVLSVLFALFSIQNVQGNARVVNYAGVVRGASQMLVKQEISGMEDDALIKRLDKLINGLQNGDEENNLVKLEDKDFQRQLLVVKDLWKQIKEEIKNVRNGKDKQHLFDLSEQYFKETNTAVGAAEIYTEKKVQQAKHGLIILISVCFFLVAMIAIYTSKVTKQKQAIKKVEEENKKKQRYLSMMATQLQAPLNEISELLYVSDIENYELLFLNQAGQESFHAYDFYGKKCYEVLQGRKSPCPFCTNSILKENEIYSWEFDNPISKKHYLLKDRKILWDNRLARLEIAFDMTKLENEKNALQITLEAQQMIVNCIHYLYDNHDIKKSINVVLAKIGNYLHADRVYLVSLKGELVNKDWEWCKSNVSSLLDLRDLPYSMIQRWLQTFGQRNYMILNNIEELKESSKEEYNVLKENGIYRMVSSPLKSNGVITGIIGVDNPPLENIQNIASLLETLCYFIGLSIKRDHAEKELSRLSYHDMLTSFYNRNRYIEDIEKMKKVHQSIGVIYLDINGLKDVNDQYGHDKGDDLIIQASNTLREVFHQAKIYRIGGDEFVIIYLGIEESLFYDRITSLRNKITPDGMLQVALGAIWAKDTSNIDQMIAEADAMMYKDKQEYYHHHKTSKRYRSYTNTK